MNGMGRVTARDVLGCLVALGILAVIWGFVGLIVWVLLWLS